MPKRQSDLRKYPELPTVTDWNNAEQVQEWRRAYYRMRYQNEPETRAGRQDDHREWLEQPGKKEYAKVCNSAWREEMKEMCLRAYGGNPPRCYCCGETNIAFLTIDHLDNDGAEHRRALEKKQLFYAELVRSGFPRDRNLAVACWNCNCGRKANKGICPHVHAFSAREEKQRLKVELGIKERVGGPRAKLLGRAQSEPSEAPQPDET